MNDDKDGPPYFELPIGIEQHSYKITLIVTKLCNKHNVWFVESQRTPFEGVIHWALLDKHTRIGATEAAK
jgi:hypothetical protein